jgi:hypothetical protein
MVEQARQSRGGFGVCRHDACLCRCGGRKRDGGNGKCCECFHGASPLEISNQVQKPVAP